MSVDRVNCLHPMFVLSERRKVSKKLMLGNEAAALGAFLAGVKVASAYPGTPSTEILENLVKYEGVYAEWAPNEKVALEVASGASLAGKRALAAMKHVGLNVAADPFFTLGLTGVNGGLVVVSADDPGMHSSQNEQDNRYYAKAAKVPMLEPSDSQEVVDMMLEAFKISEEFDVPVLLRMTTRVSHSRTLVAIREAAEAIARVYEKDARKYVMVPGHARIRHLFALERLNELEAYSESSSFNNAIGDKSPGIITSGISYQYAREVFTDAKILKLGMTNPLPRDMISDFAKDFEYVYVIEELEPFLEEQIQSMGINTLGKKALPRFGELNQSIIGSALGQKEPEAVKLPEDLVLPPRPPVLCPGCPHRGLFYALRKLKLTVTGDIGCYTLGALPPLAAMDTCLCMGASIGQAHGFVKASAESHDRVVGIIGDSTFIHSGITSLINVVYNLGTTTTIIADNRTTAMTGHQQHPGTGRTLSGKETIALDIESLAEAIGVKNIRVIDPLDLEETIKIIREETLRQEPSVIITRRPCVLLTKEHEEALVVDAKACTGCKICLQLGCPSIIFKDSVAVIEETSCLGCGLCAEVCRQNAVNRKGDR